MKIPSRDKRYRGTNAFVYINIGEIGDNLNQITKDYLPTCIVVSLQPFSLDNEIKMLSK